MSQKAYLQNRLGWNDVDKRHRLDSELDGKSGFIFKAAFYCVLNDRT